MIFVGKMWCGGVVTRERVPVPDCFKNITPSGMFQSACGLRDYSSWTSDKNGAVEEETDHIRFGRSCRKHKRGLLCRQFLCDDGRERVSAAQHK